MKLLIPLSFLFISACSSISPYKGDSAIIDEAIKLCGVGYSTEASSIIKTAYNMTDASGGADFGAALRENLNTQVMLFATNSNISSNEDKKPLFDLINKTQDCVIAQVEKSRPLTRQRVIEYCAAELQDSVAGKGKKSPLVRNTVARVNHPDYSDTNVIMYAFVEHSWSKMNYDILVSCEVRDNKYFGLSILQKKE